MECGKEEGGGEGKKEGRGEKNEEGEDGGEVRYRGREWERERCKRRVMGRDGRNEREGQGRGDKCWAKGGARGRQKVEG